MNYVTEGLPELPIQIKKFFVAVPVTMCCFYFPHPCKKQTGRQTLMKQDQMRMQALE